LFKELIKNMIETEIMQRFHYKKGVLLHQLASDKVYHKAIELLQDRPGYHRVLQPSQGETTPADQVVS
jgi:carboxyl-terminal processing protease